jgi:hypothetical protein
MTTEQFNLSKRIINQEPDKWLKGYPIFHKAILLEDVKEFIRELKCDANKIFEDSYTLTKYQFNKILKERAGKELIEDNHNTTKKGVKNGNN